MSEELCSSIEFRRFSAVWKPALMAFFYDLQENGDEKWFHPHPFSHDFLDSLCGYQGKDLYYIAVEANKVLGYGLLRGWDQGFDIPSLGIAIHPKIRGIGLATVFMHFLHLAALRQGALHIRLKVYPHNIRAIKLYESLGYNFQGIENQQMVGSLTLK